MGLADRDYYREPQRGHRPPGMGTVRPLSVNTWIILVNVAVFLIAQAFSQNGIPVVQEVVFGDGASRGTRAGPYFVAMPPDGTALRPASDVEQRQVGRPLVQFVFNPSTGERIGQAFLIVMDPLTAYGHFSTTLGFQSLEVWRLVTFQFLHANFMHLFFNMFGLWVFGGMVEEYLGRRKYLAFYLACGIFGGLAYLLLNFMGGVLNWSLPAVLIHDPRVPLVGASAGVFGVIMAGAKIAPREIVFAPVPVPLRFLAYGYVIIAAANLILGGSNAGGDAAHVGGALAGAFFIRRSYLLKDFFDIWSDSRPSQAKPERAVRVAPAPPPDAAEIDRVLAKVSATGMESLTEEEREVLRRGTARRIAGS